MNWVRVKTILIVVFLIVNIFLVLKISDKTNHKELNPQELLDIKQLLSNNSIILHTDIPTKVSYMQRIKVTEAAEESILADKLIGFGKWTKKNNSKRETIYIGYNKQLNVSKDGEFEITIDDKANNFKQLKDENVIKNYLSKILGEYIEAKNYSLISTVERDNLIELNLKYIYKGHEVFNNYVQVKIFKEGKIIIKMGLINLSGFTGKTDKVTPIDAFVELVGNTQGQKTIVNKITLGYYADINKDGEIVKYGKLMADPAWKIQTDKGVYIFDGYNGSCVYKSLK